MRSRSLRMLLFALVVLCMSAASFAQVRVGVVVGFPPPPLPVYEQPLCPGDGYLWTPGYWAYGDDFDDYFWVPGTWVLAPEVGFLWTPGYWGWGDSGFVFYDGYWGPVVGFYGGINYGFGYFGEGYEGGRWDHDHFFYNRAVNNVNVTDIHNVYNTTVVNRNDTRVSYNGGNGGIDRRPTPAEEAAAKDRHIPPVAAQTQHLQEARNNPQQRATANMGKPPVAATAKPGEFNDHPVRAREAGGTYTPPPNRGGNRPGQPEPARSGNNASQPSTYVHAKDLPPEEHPPAPNTGNAKLDRKYQQQQDKQFAQQQKERQKLQQQQEKEDQKLQKQNADAAKRQQTEQRHQQQTQQLQQRHTQEQQQMQQRMQPQPSRSRPPK